MNPKNYKSWFFDCDGVILDSNSLKTRAYYDVALPYGSDVADHLVTYHKENGGVSRFDKMRYLHLSMLGDEDDGRVNESIAKFAALLKTKLYECAENEGFREFLTDLPADIESFVVSGSEESELHDVLKHKNLYSNFQGVFGSPRTKYEIIETLLASKATRGKDAIFIGDSKLDYEVAHSFGFDFIFMFGLTEFDEWKPYFESIENVLITENFETLVQQKFISVF